MPSGIAEADVALCSTPIGKQAALFSHKINTDSFSAHADVGREGNRLFKDSQ